MPTIVSPPAVPRISTSVGLLKKHALTALQEGRSGDDPGYRGVCLASEPIRRLPPDPGPGKEETPCYSSLVALNIKDDRADQLARELAAETGESITTAVTIAVRERLQRLRGAVPRERRREELTHISKRSAERGVRDRRSAEEILGYGSDGLPS